jgi:UDP-N-acetyl-2-amino-2-deoxyglucuronate dehydrogenase
MTLNPVVFAMTGVAGYVAPRHLEAIRATGHRLVAATDPHDSVGVIDRFFPEAAYFTEFERFDRHLERLRRLSDHDRVRMISICAPNHLHDAHVRLALRIGADAICEKPLVLNPWNLDALSGLEEESGQRVWTVLQLRLHPELLGLRARIAASHSRHAVKVTYVTPRGPWYRYSWKGDVERSGGIMTNIGIHLFDLMLWLFGGVDRAAVHVNEAQRAAGTLTLERADVSWLLSIDRRDLPSTGGTDPPSSFREIEIDGQCIDFAAGFTHLHTEVYRATMSGGGFGIEDARPSIELVYRLRRAAPISDRSGAHPWLETGGVG